MTTDRPNTVAGLMAKRKQLLKLREQLQHELRKITTDIDHLEGAISLFDPANTPQARERYVTKYRAQKGELRRFVLRFLRGRSELATTREITEAWIEHRGLRGDYDTYTVLRKRTTQCLVAMRHAGMLTSQPLDGEHNGWRLA